MKRETLRLKKLVKIIKGTCSIFGRIKNRISSKLMTKGEDFVRNAKCKRGHRSAMSNSAWCDLNKNCNVLKLHDMCHSPKCNCEKQMTFSPRQFDSESNELKNTIKNYSRDFKQLGIIF